MNNQQHIHCIIDDYYYVHNKCQVKEILPLPTSLERTQPDQVDCEMAAELVRKRLRHCMDTCCKPMYPKIKQNKRRWSKKIIR